MASSTKLVMTFTCEDGKDHDFSYKYANTEVATGKVKAAMETLITNGSIFEYPPVKKVTAKFVVTSEEELDIS